MAITAHDLAKIANTKKPGRHAEAIAAAFNEYASEFGVTTQEDIAAALANFSVETGGFNSLEENMNYSANRLMAVWPSRFPTLASTKGFAKNPRALANKVYGSRMGNKGREDAGWIYRGSGLGQTTGYTNFKLCEDLTGYPFVSKPDLMRTPKLGTVGALALWKNFGMSKFSKASLLTAGRKKWNGGTHGLAQVKAAFDRAMNLVLTVPGAVILPPSIFELKIVDEPIAYSKTEVAYVQSRLHDLGYTEVGSRQKDGTFDGTKGKMTDAAILAFRSEHRLPLTAEIDDDLMVALNTAKRRELSPEREHASPATVAEKVPEAKSNWWARFWAKWSTTGTMASGVVGGAAKALEYTEEAKGYLDPVREFIPDLSTVALLLLFGVVLFVIWRQATKTEKAQVEAFQTGARR